MGSFINPLVSTYPSACLPSPEWRGPLLASLPRPELGLGLQNVITFQQPMTFCKSSWLVPNGPKQTPSVNQRIIIGRYFTYGIRTWASAGGPFAPSFPFSFFWVSLQRLFCLPRTLLA